MLRIATNDYLAALCQIWTKFFKRSLTMNFRSIPIMDVRIRTPDRRFSNLMLKFFLYSSKSISVWNFIQIHLLCSRTINFDSDVEARIRTLDRRIANLMIKVSLTDRQLSSCEISLKSDRPFSQNRCVTSTHTHTHTHTHTQTGLQWWSKKNTPIL